MLKKEKGEKMKSAKAVSSIIILVMTLPMVGVIPIEARGESRGSDWVPSTTGDSYAVENAWMKLESDSGFDNQGPYTIVNALNKWLVGWPDGMWYGEYEYVSVDDGATWTWLKLANGFTRTLTENVANKDYTITFNTAGTALANLAITKRIIISDTLPRASLIYTIGRMSGDPVPVKLYYSPDFCDWDTTGNRWDKIFDESWTQVTTSGWYWTNGFWVDTLGSGSWGLWTDFPAWYYAGYWWRALYGADWHPWTSGENIGIWDLGIGVIIDFGTIGSSVSRSLGHPDSETSGEPEEPDWPGPPNEPAHELEVGGVWVPVDKLGLLTPYISLVSTMVVATVVTAIYVRRVKRREEK